MARYFPEPVPYTDDIPYIREWLGREFSNVLAAFEEVELVQLEETHVAPTAPREGMIRLADGTDWNPGQGSGFYGYRDGAWFKLDLDSTDDATFARLRLTATDDLTLSSTLHPLQIGPTSGANLRVDVNEIQAVNNGAVALLALQNEGGNATYGASGSSHIFRGTPFEYHGNNAFAIFRMQNSVNGNIELGRQDGTASTPHIDFHSGATAVDHDARIIASGGTGADNGGSLSIESATLTATRLNLTATDDASLSSTLHPLQLGPTSGANLILDPNEILARNNGATSELNLQANSGAIVCHSADASNALSLLDLRGGRIVFPATQIASTDANTLDDYEEGSWTPTLTFGGGATGMTFSQQLGRYVKIGRLVHIWARIILTAKGTSTGNAQLNGLPFTSDSFSFGIHETGVAAFYSNMSGLTSPILVYNDGGATTCTMTHGGATGVANLTDGNFTNSSDFLVSITYRAGG